MVWVCLLSGALVVPLGPVEAASQASERIVASAARVSALRLLSQLPVRVESGAGYVRAKFGSGWTDVNHNGCSTRSEVLIRESKVHPRQGAGCRLTLGTWLSIYDGARFAVSGSLDIDHMVPLAEAWASGARGWTASTRSAFANDLGYLYSLNAVSANSNRSKGDREPGSWMPSNRAYRCTYLASWVAVKWRWRLSVDAGEKRKLVTALTACGSRAMIATPSRATVHLGSGGSSGGGSDATPPPSSGNDPRYATCTAAKAAGYGPYYRGRDSEYAWYTDRDSDGIACE
ncbi:unannotated protein [freshwater metagenome]|uniref:Unannotated protein n=1 Tax=freshwater metagenome TaxID=449393 RepID=A0A6J7NMI3_9ZZZZ